MLVDIRELNKMELKHSLLSLLCCCTLVHGHGNMVDPMAWWDVNRHGWTWGEDGGNNRLGCGVLDLPENNEFTDVTGKEPDCFEYWFSNGIEIPGEATLPEEMSQGDYP